MEEEIREEHMEETVQDSGEEMKRSVPEGNETSPEASAEEENAADEMAGRKDAGEADETSPETAAGEDAAAKKAEDSQTDEKLMAAIEAILFTMGESVEIGAIAKALDISAARVRKILVRLKKRYDAPSRGIMIQQFDDAVQMSTKPEQYENLIRIAKVPKKMTLSDSVIETLSIVAYKQPITKVEVEGIRGVSCDYAINKLLEYDLIKELGRKDAPGRPILFGTTEQFLRSFGVKNLAELPSVNTVQVEEFKEEAEAEVDDRLGI